MLTICHHVACRIQLNLSFQEPALRRVSDEDKDAEIVTIFGFYKTLFPALPIFKDEAADSAVTLDPHHLRMIGNRNIRMLFQLIDSCRRDRKVISANKDMDFAPVLSEEKGFLHGCIPTANNKDVHRTRLPESFQGLH